MTFFCVYTYSCNWYHIFIDAPHSNSKCSYNDPMKHVAAGKNNRMESSRSCVMIIRSTKRGAMTTKTKTADRTPPKDSIEMQATTRTRRNSCNRIPSLPDGPVVNILSFLTWNDAVQSCSRVSKIWYKMLCCANHVTLVIPHTSCNSTRTIQQQNAVWNEKQVQQFVRNMLAYTASRFPRDGNNVTRMEIRFEEGHNYQIEDVVLAEFLSHFPRLKSFVYNGTQELSERRRGWKINVAFDPIEAQTR